MQQETTPARMALDEREYLEAVAAHEPASTSEVAEAVGVTRQGADYRLRGLEDDGKVASKMVGNSLIWFRVDDPADDDGVDEGDVHAGRETSSAPADETGDRSLADDPRRDDGPSTTLRETSDDGDDPDAALEELLESVDVPGSGAKAADRRDAVRETIDYLREQGTIQRQTYYDDVYPDHADNVRYSDAYSAWTNCVYPALGEIAEDEDRLEKPDTTGVWRWRG